MLPFVLRHTLQPGSLVHARDLGESIIEFHPFSPLAACPCLTLFFRAAHGPLVGQASLQVFELLRRLPKPVGSLNGLAGCLGDSVEKFPEAIGSLSAGAKNLAERLAFALKVREG